MSVIRRLQKKYPEKVLIAVDSRSAFVTESSSSKDLYLTIPIVRAKRPRSCETIVLNWFDEELGLYLAMENGVIYYMPGEGNRHCSYAICIATEGDTVELVANLIKAALSQSQTEHGCMKTGETRMFWVASEQLPEPYPFIHVTVAREHRQYRVAAELGRSDFQRYTTLLSMGVKVGAVK